MRSTTRPTPDEARKGAKDGIEAKESFGKRLDKKSEREEEVRVECFLNLRGIGWIGPRAKSAG